MINLKFSKKEEPFYDVKMDSEGNVLYFNQKGKLHRLNGPAVEDSDGYKAYFVNGKRHRLDGPAIEHISGYKAYYVNNKLHRLDGPAKIWPNGDVEYWVNDIQLTKEEFEKLRKERKGL